MATIRSVSALEVRARGLAQELACCRLVHQPKGIFGRPDYANKKRKVAIFVDGCLWHCCPIHFKMPKTNVEFWAKKLARNVERRHEVVCRLMSEGWNVITIWEHEIKHYEKTIRRTKERPGSNRADGQRHRVEHPAQQPKLQSQSQDVPEASHVP